MHKLTQWTTKNIRDHKYKIMFSTLSYCLFSLLLPSSHIVIALSTFAIEKVVALNLFALLFVSFLDRFNVHSLFSILLPYSYQSGNYYYSLISNYWRKRKKKSRKILKNTLKDIIEIKSNITIAIWGKLQFDRQTIIAHFGWSNIFFADTKNLPSTHKHSK